MRKYGTKNVLFWYFRARILKYYFDILKELTRICLVAKFCEKTKMPGFGIKKALFRFFWTKILKQYCHILNPHPQICLVAKFREKTKMPEFWP